MYSNHGFFFSLGFCIWCGHDKILLPNKRFCKICSENGPECQNCHRPMSSKYFTINSTTCDACMRKRNKIGGKRNLSDSVSVFTITPSDSLEGEDLKTFLNNRQVEIREYINKEILDHGSAKLYFDCIVTLEKKSSNPMWSNERSYRSTNIQNKS